MSDLTAATRYFDALKRITMYDAPERLRKRSERDYGLDGNEAIEMAYENVLNEARMAIKGKRRPGTVPAKIKREAARSIRADVLGENGNG